MTQYPKHPSLNPLPQGERGKFRSLVYWLLFDDWCLEFGACSFQLSNQRRSDRVFLYLLCAFVDFGDLGIPVETLDFVSRDIPVTPEGLDGLIRNFTSHFRCKHLGHGGQFRVDPLLVIVPGCLVGQKPCRLYLCCHISQFMLGDLEIDQFSSKLLPLLGVIESPVESALGNTESLSRNLNSTLIEKFEDLIESFILFTKKVRQRDPDIAEGEFGCGGHPDSHLGRDLRCLQPFCALFNDDRD